jgi:hypothetical protein
LFLLHHQALSPLSNYLLSFGSIRPELMPGYEHPKVRLPKEEKEKKVKNDKEEESEEEDEEDEGIGGVKMYVESVQV